MSNRRVQCVLAVVVLSSGSVLSQVAQEPSGTTTGRRIGTVVVAAIETALPGVTKLVDAIWGSRSSSDKVNKDQLKTMVGDARQTLLQQVRQALTPIVTLSDELEVINRFLQATSSANANVGRMQNRLSDKANMTDETWGDQREDWLVAKAQLENISRVPDNDLSKIGNLWVRDQLRRLREANVDLVIRVDERIRSKDAAGLGKNLQQLASILGDIEPIVGYELADLRSDARNISNWANAERSLPFVAPETQTFRIILENKHQGR